MARYSPLINSFNAGEWGPRSYARVDLEKYGSSLRLCENFVPTIQGPVRKRTGSIYVANTADSATKVSRLIPYKVSRTDAYTLEVSDGAITLRDSLGATVAGSITGDAPPWSDTELGEIQFAQTGQLLYLTHPDHVTYQWRYNAADGKHLLAVTSNVGPLQAENDNTAITVTASAATGSVTLTASSALFTAAMAPAGGAPAASGQLFAFRCIPETLTDRWVTATAYSVGDRVWSESYETPGRINVYRCTGAGTSGTLAPGHDLGTESDGGADWLMIHSEMAFCRITAVASGTSATATVVGFPELPSSALAGDFRWSMGSWSREFGFPRAVSFFEQRMVLGGTRQEPQTIWGSAIAAFTDFNTRSVGEANAYSYTLAADENNEISFLSAGRALTIGTEGGEFYATGGTSAAITPTNIQVRRDTKSGSRKQQAIQVGESVLFVQAGGKRLRESIYDDQRDGYVANDLSLLAHHLGDLGLNRLAYQNEPDSVLWTYSDDGTLLGMTYEREQQVIGWHRHTLGGDGAVESVATIPDENGVNDRLWLIVRRTIDGATERHIEYIDDARDDIWSDAAVVYDGAATDTITGLGHLEGEEVSVQVDGAVHPNRTVSGGQITLQEEGEVVVVGLPYVGRLRTQTIEGGSETGVSQGKSKRVHSVSLRMIDTGPGLFIGPNADQMEQVIFRSAGDLMDAPVPVVTDDSDLVPLEYGYADRAILYLEHRLPQPCTLSAIWAQLVVYDDR